MKRIVIMLVVMVAAVVRENKKEWQSPAQVTDADVMRAVQGAQHLPRHDEGPRQFRVGVSFLAPGKNGNDVCLRFLRWVFPSALPPAVRPTSTPLFHSI